MVEGARPFDPEYIGYMLATVVPGPIDDFQDMPLRRELAVQILSGLERDYAGSAVAELPGLSTVELDTREFDVTLPPDDVATALRWVQQDAR
jgi:hypothetical protein